MNDPPQLALTDAGGQIDWLPDETVYSLASRYHLLSGAARPDITAQRLFGHRRGGFPHDLPGGLGYFAEAFAGRLGSVSRIAMERTILPLLIAFRSDAQRQDAMATVTAQSIKGLKSRLGLPASGFGASYPLKACEACLRSDEREHGTAYWHLAHQLPGAWVCIKHQKELLVSSSKRAGQNRFGWTLPAIRDLAEASPRTGADVDPIERSRMLYELARASIEASSSDQESISWRRDASERLLSRLRETGLASASGRLHMRQLVVKFRASMHSVSNIPELATIAHSDGSAKAQLYRILNDPSHSGHPLRYLSMIVWAFGSWDQFLQHRIGTPQQPDGLSNQSVVATDAADLRKRDLAIEWIREKTYSISQAARRAGVDVATAQAWASAAGIQPPKRPSKLRRGTNDALLRHLRSGMDKDRAAKLAGVSVSSVNRTLRTNVDLHRAWQDARHEHAGSAAKSQWQQALRTCQHLGSAAARQIAPAAYAWLYRNDRGWLTASIEAIPKIERGNHSKVAWDARDAALSQKVNEAAQRVLESNRTGKRVRLVEILKHVPEIKSKLHRESALPLTIKALKRILR